MKLGEMGKKMLKFLNPFHDMMEARRELKKLSDESEKLDHELEKIKDKKRKVLYTKQ